MPFLTAALCLAVMCVAPLLAGAGVVVVCLAMVLCGVMLCMGGYIVQPLPYMGGATTRHYPHNKQYIYSCTLQVKPCTFLAFLCSFICTGGTGGGTGGTPYW